MKLHSRTVTTITDYILYEAHSDSSFVIDRCIKSAIPCAFVRNKNIKMSSFKSNENIQKECWPDRSILVSDPK